MRSIARGLCFAVAMAGMAVFGYVAGRERVAPVREVEAVSAPSEDPIERFRAERNQTRQMQISQLNELIHGVNTEEEIAGMAQARLLDLMDWMEKETTLEGVLQMRAFRDVVATVHGDSVSILVRSDALSREQAGVILELALRETGVSSENVKIIPIN